jgi:pilus assembly protein FimV
MSSGKNPLMLMMALAMPGAAQAIGLGDIHVVSNLNERLVAEIDIVGASPEELANLNAAVANRETFTRLGVDRPAFLASATFKVTKNTQGHPVLSVRSSDAFTEPLVNFLVDLRWHNGEVVREYTLLLDPAGFASSVPVPITPAAPPSIAPAGRPTVENKTQTVASSGEPVAEPAAAASAELGTRTMSQMKVGPKATLRGIAWRVGERSPSDLQRMMIAIFRANPRAFDGNINRMHLGAVLSIPSHADLDSISRADAKREVHSQMTAWRAAGGKGNPVVVKRAAPAEAPATMAAGPSVTPSNTSAATDSVAPVAAATAAAATASGTPSTDAEKPTSATDAASEEEAKALGQKVQSLEQELGAVKGLLDNENQQLEGLQQQELRADKTEPVEPQIEADEPVKAQTEAPVEEPAPKHSSMVPIAVGLGTLGAALAALYFRLRRRKPSKAGEPMSDSMADTVVVGSEQAPAPLPAPIPAVIATPVVQAQPKPEPKISAPAPAPLVAQGDVSEDDLALERAIEAAAIYEATHPMLPVMPDATTVATGIIEPDATAVLELSRSESQTATVKLPAATVILPAATLKMPTETAGKSTAVPATAVETKLDYNLLDLDMTVQHVQMPSALNENTVVKERRTNLADVLKLALEREPNRDDLRMKLLELYYSAASTNRNGFLDVVQKLAQDRDYRQSEHWEKIAFMGRQILSDSPLFLDELAGDDDVEDVRKVS